MTVLLLFAFISGLITIAAPCIWPLLPIVLSASATGGHRKPLGVTLGILLSFGLLTLSISYLVTLIGLDPNVLRTLAVFVLVFLGLTLLIPYLSARLEAYVSRFSGRLNLGNQTKTGFVPGLISGAALGIVWTPCAGPILATIATLSATQKVNSSLILVTFVYILGIGVPLFLFAYFGRHFFQKTKYLSPYLGKIQQVFGVVMIITALLIFTNYDKVLSAKLLDFFPSYSSLLTKFEGGAAGQLNLLKNQKKQTNIDENNLFNANSTAPEFSGITNWINSEPLTISELKGKVVLVDFWTYTCINCIRTLPHVTSWYEKYKDQGFIVIGVHTPEFEFEKNTSNVISATKQYKINYPVAQDNDYSVWDDYSNQYWPAEYLIDSKGAIRRVHFGEGEYDQMEMAIRSLLKEKGVKITTALVDMMDQTPTGTLSPETYLGGARMQYYYPNGSVLGGQSNFSLREKPPENTFSLGGTWNIESENAEAIKNAALTYNFYSDKVFLVLKPGPNSSTIKIYLDGKLIDEGNSGIDVKNGIVTLDKDRLYNLVDLKNGPSSHILKIEFSNGIKAFAFTFG